MEFSYDIKVPKDRVAVLVGVKGSVKRKIEKSLSVSLTIDSKEGDVLLQGDDSLDLLTAQNIVRAIARGFNPDVALELLNENNYLEIVDIEQYSGSTKKRFIMVKSRAIGTGGKSRKTIEDLTNTNIVVYGKTVGIIGDYESVALARRAFESLLEGSRHTTVYAWLERQRKGMKARLY